MSTLKDILDAAIQGEINAQKLYQRGVDIAQNDEIKKFFEQLVKEETNHENILFNLKATEVYNLDVPVTDPELVEEIKNSHGNINVAFDESWDMNMVLETALKREFGAMNRYKKAAEASTDDELSTLFNNLSLEEASHHKRIEKQFNKIQGLNEREM